MDDIAICQIHAGGGDGADILLDCNGARPNLRIYFPSTLPVYDGQSDKRGYFAEDQLINLLNRAVSIDIDDDECEEIVDETGTILKASNAIIDTEDDVWLVDFGGGWTEGWADGKLASTVERNEQAVRRIK